MTNKKKRGNRGRSAKTKKSNAPLIVLVSVGGLMLLIILLLIGMERNNVSNKHLGAAVNGVCVPSYEDKYVQGTYRKVYLGQVTHPVSSEEKREWRRKAKQEIEEEFCMQEINKIQRENPLYCTDDDCTATSEPKCTIKRGDLVVSDPIFSVYEEESLSDPSSSPNPSPSPGDRLNMTFNALIKKARIYITCEVTESETPEVLQPSSCSKSGDNCDPEAMGAYKLPESMPAIGFGEAPTDQDEDDNLNITEMQERAKTRAIEDALSNGGKKVCEEFASASNDDNFMSNQCWPDDENKGCSDNCYSAGSTSYSSHEVPYSAYNCSVSMFEAREDSYGDVNWIKYKAKCTGVQCTFEQECRVREETNTPEPSESETTTPYETSMY